MIHVYSDTENNHFVKIDGDAETLLDETYALLHTLLQNGIIIDDLQEALNDAADNNRANETDGTQYCN